MISTVPHMTDQDLGFPTMPPLIEVRQDGDDRWTTLQPLHYRAKTQSFEVPKDSTTDFASVPRPFAWFIPRYGRFTAAAILHDHLCSVEVPEGTLTRADADGIFRQAMRLLGVPFLRRWIMWSGVRLGALASADDRRQWLAGGTWRLFPLAVLILPVVGPAAIVVVATMAVFYVVERLFWPPLELARRSRANRQLPQEKRVNAPEWRWRL
jgi:hypothetical protein